MKNPWLWAAVLGAGYILFLRKAIQDKPPPPQYGDLPPPADVSRVDEGLFDEYGMPLVSQGDMIDEGSLLAEKIWGYSKVPSVEQLRQLNLRRGY